MRLETNPLPTVDTPIWCRKAHGKLLLTSEYVVLCGAKALALPTRFGQTLSVYPIDSQEEFEWCVVDIEGECIYNQRWSADLKCVLDPHPWDLKLKEFLNAFLYQRKSTLYSHILGYRFYFQLDFNPQWGLGTSSTLLALLGDYFQLDPYRVLERTIGGSGYDLACAFSTGPISYRIAPDTAQREIQQHTFDPPYGQQIHFVYQNKKQHSDVQIRAFDKGRITAKQLSFFSELSLRILECQNMEHFSDLVNQHEHHMATILDRPRLSSRFPDFSGSLKSLGAWGGDFMLAVGDTSYINTYFNTKGFHTILSWKEMIK